MSEEVREMRKLVTCSHCGGKKNCTVSGGKSCAECLAASGKGRRQFAAVRCSYCGGRGSVWLEVDEDEADADETADEAGAADETSEDAESEE